MATRENVCVLIPAYDEAATIGEVIEGFRERGFQNVLVVDGHSTDDTPEIAAEAGARVITQSGHGRGGGKGQAIREGVAAAEAPYIVMLDGDGTYDPADADAMLEPLLSGEAEHVIGDRFADMDADAMTRFNGVGNHVINRAFAYVHGRDLEDILSGYRAFTRASFDRCNPTRDDFGIETELAVECVKRGIPTVVVPTSYRARPDGSETNLRPVRDGGRILVAMYRLAKTNNPLFYFGSVGALSTLAGVLLGIYVLVEWLTVSVSHEVLAVVTAFAVLFGVQLLIFGVLSDMIVALNREQTRRIEKVVGWRTGDTIQDGQWADTYRTEPNSYSPDKKSASETDPEDTTAEDVAPESRPRTHESAPTVSRSATHAESSRPPESSRPVESSDPSDGDAE